MMGYGGYGSMMGWVSGVGLLGLLFWTVIFIDAVLLGIWLWRQLNKK